MGFEPFDVVLFHTIKHKEGSLAITAVTAAASLTYVGTRDGKLIVYEYQQSGADELYQCRGMKAMQMAAPGTPIDKIIAVAEFASVLVLCGGQLHIMNMFSLETAATIPKELGSTEATVRAIGKFMGVAGDNGITNFAVQYPHNTFRVCCQVSRGQLAFYEIGGSRTEQPVPYLTIPLTDAQLGLQLEWTKQRCFLGTPHDYLSFDLATGQAQQLFTIESNSRPLMVCTGEDLLLVSDRVGVFVDFEGRITRGSITWSAPVLSVSYHHPYIVALLVGNVIEMHNIYKQALVQTLAPPQGALTISKGELLFTARRDLIYTLRCLPLQHQLEQLVDLQRVQDALELAKAMWTEAPQKLRSFYTRVGLVWFTQGAFEQAVPVLLGSSIDVRELIALFPDLALPQEAAPFQREFSYELASTVDPSAAREQLLKILEAKRHPSLQPSLLQWLDTALLKLYVEMEDAKVDALLESSQHILFADAEACLVAQGIQHHLVKLYKAHHKVPQALSCIESIGLEQIIRTGYDPLDDAVALLIECEDAELMFQHARWAMERDASRAIRIFTAPDRRVELDQQAVMALLAEHGKFYQIEYMEFLIFVRGLRDETLHTQMGVFCIDVLQEANQAPTMARQGRRRARTVQPGAKRIEPAMLKKVESNLMQLLQFSEDYNSALLLGRIQGDSMMWDACVVLYSRLGRHKEALDILVHKKQDFAAADDYCSQHSEAAATNLFFDLLHFYMDNGVQNASEIPENAFNLMNARGADFDPLEVLRILPDDIPVEKIESFLCSSYQNAITEKRMKQVEANLCRMERILINSRLHNTQSKSITVDRSILCGVCKQPIADSVFATYPNGLAVHFKCMKDPHICPVTKRDFRENPGAI